MAGKRRTLSERLWAKIDNSDGHPAACWPFTGFLNYNGYGQISSTRHGRTIMVRAHRAVLEEVIGHLGDKQALHICNNPSCCRPSHIYAGVHRDNMDDMTRAGRQARGESNARAKLSLSEIRQIRADRRLQREIATEFNVTRGHVSAIKCRRKWAYLPAP